MRLRVVSLFVFLLSLAASTAEAADVSFVRVWPGWRDADSFDSISEYFTGKENTGRRLTLRTQPAERAGFYFLVRLTNTGPANATAKFRLQVILPDSPVTRTFDFPATLPAKSAVFQLGLTGTDWPDAKIQPVAWKLELLGGDDAVLATEQSFLWSMPTPTARGDAQP